MNFSHISVGARLGLGFALVILAGLAVAAFGGLQLHAIQQSTTLLVEDRLVRIEQLNQVLGHANIEARAVRNIALLDDEQVREAEKRRMDEARAASDRLLQQLKVALDTPESRKTLERLEQVYTRYAAATDKAANLGLAGQGTMAGDVLIRESRPLQTAFFDTLQELIGLQRAAMQDTAKGVQEQARSTTGLMAAVAALAAAVGAAMAWWLTRSITRQLGGEPDYAVEVARQIAAGNLTVPVQLRAGDEGSLLAAMRTMRDSLAQVVSRVRQGSESVASASTQIAHGNQDLSGRTESQASSLQQTAASMEELGATVRHNADNARQADQLAQSASAVAVQGGEVVAQVVSTMRGINDASRQIADIIQVIDSIAFQTNILALNAAVEAARAGEQGRGFAVVAGEVRSLAQRSAEAAKEIKQLITNSVERVQQGTQLVDRAGATMEQVVAGIRRVTDIMAEISAASTEQSQGVAQVGEAVAQMDQVTQQNAALVEEMAAAAASLNHQAQDLVQAVSVFQLAQGDEAAAALRASVPAPQAERPAAARPPAQAPAAAAKVLPRASAAPAAPAAGDDWEAF